MSPRQTLPLSQLPLHVMSYPLGVSMIFMLHLSTDRNVLATPITREATKNAKNTLEMRLSL
jgi:hypothetical protein